jgi:hypothetical protein
MAKGIIRKLDKNFTKYGSIPIAGAVLAATFGMSPAAGTVTLIASLLPYSIYVESDAKVTADEILECGLCLENRCVVTAEEPGIYRVPRNKIYGFPVLPCF